LKNPLIATPLKWEATMSNYRLRRQAWELAGSLTDVTDGLAGPVIAKEPAHSEAYGQLGGSWRVVLRVFDRHPRGVRRRRVHTGPGRQRLRAGARHGQADLGVPGGAYPRAVAPGLTAWRWRTGRCTATPRARSLPSARLPARRPGWTATCSTKAKGCSRSSRRWPTGGSTWRARRAPATGCSWRSMRPTAKAGQDGEDIRRTA